MKKTRKILGTLLAGLTIGVGALGLTSCGFGVSQNFNSSESSKPITNKWTMETVYAQAQELGYTGSLDDFIELVSGKDGVDGKDGVGIKSMSVNAVGNLIVKMSNDMEIDLGVITGKDGKDG